MAWSTQPRAIGSPCRSGEELPPGPPEPEEQVGASRMAPRRPSTSSTARARPRSAASASTLEAGTLAVVPELVPHAVYNTGDTTLKVVGFFAAAELEHVFEHAAAADGHQRRAHADGREVPA